MTRQWHIANILTASRLAMIPLFLLFFAIEWYPGAFLTFGIASFTDLIDGTVARMIKKPSQFGAFLDPLADKLLMVATFICLTVMKMIPLWFIVVLILRDTMIIGGVAFLKWRKIKIKIQPVLTGKISTLSQIVLGLLCLGFLWFPNFQFWRYPISDFIEGSFMITAVLVVVTWLQYMAKGLEILQKEGLKNVVG